MVRNIDLPEALVFYGWDSLVDSETGEPLPGVKSLLQECEDIDAAAILIAESISSEEQQSRLTAAQEQFPNLSIHVETPRRETPSSFFLPPPPNPRALSSVLDSALVQPKGFGGSSGFGRKAADPERPPLPQRAVVLGTSEDHCRAARYAGTRAVCLDTDSDLADAVVSGWDEICVDDIATPGSYWLNPPHPKDDGGNRVDLDKVMRYYEEGEGETKRNSGEEDGGGVADAPMSSDKMDAILADLDPL